MSYWPQVNLAACDLNMNAINDLCSKTRAEDDAEQGMQTSARRNREQFTDSNCLERHDDVSRDSHF